jgi:hypothetical protein
MMTEMKVTMRMRRTRNMVRTRGGDREEDGGEEDNNNNDDVHVPVSLTFGTYVSM